MRKTALTSTLITFIATSAAAGSFYGNSPATHGFSESETHILPEPENDIDYRHMDLYELKRNLYYNRPFLRDRPFPRESTEGPNPTVIRHIHKHEHWGWGWGWGYNPIWAGINRSSSSDDTSNSFANRVGEGVKNIAVVAAVVATAATVSYGIAQAAFTLWPYMGAASLTAIELPSSSPWRITGYRVANGNVISHQHFQGNQDALNAVEEGAMFDRNRDQPGRFLLIDQENWWGLTDYPTDVDITLARSHPGGADEKATINLLRTVTNGLKAGVISADINSSAKGHSLRTLYSYSMRVKAPGYLEFRKWYHLPTRVIIDLQPVGNY